MEETQLLAPFESQEKDLMEFDDVLMEDNKVDFEVKQEEIHDDSEQRKMAHAENSRHSTPIYQMLERIENKIKAEEHQKSFGFDDLVDKIERANGFKASKPIGPKDEKDSENENLWVDKYRPQKFTQLITMDSCNLEILRWVKQWEFAKDIVMGKPKSEVLQKVDDHRKKTSKVRTKTSSPAHDNFERPERKILLLHGQPGLGKTTLAHVVAQTAGYSVMEINASDERMGNSVITKISSALEVKTSFTHEKKPTLIVIDEIDGAAAAGNENNLIKYLVKLASMKSSGGGKKGPSLTPKKETENDQSESEAESENKPFVSQKKNSNSRSENLGLLHPIICICNDLYVPALRPLRQVAHILQVKPIGPVQLSLRLKTICDREGLKINARTLVDLAEVMDSDVRSALNALQFLHKKSLIGSATNFNRELSFGAFKDTVKPPMKIYDSVFHNHTSTNSIKKSSVHQNLATSSGRKFSELLEMIWGSGLELDKLMNGCFEIYPTVKFFDNNTMDRVNSALELFSSFDLMSNPSHSSTFSSGRFDGYLAYNLCGLKDLFSSPVYSSIKYPKQDFENFQINSEIKAVFKDYLSCLSSKVRSESGSRDSLLMERIPAVLNSSLSHFANIKSSNPQLMRPEDKQKLTKVVEILSAEGLNLRQIKIPESASYKFVLDPPIDRLNLDHLTCSNSDAIFSKIYDNESTQDSHTYSLCRLVAAEMETLRIRKQKLKFAAEPNISTSATSSAESTPAPANKRKAIDISQATLPKDLKKRVARDFFGRPIAIPDDYEVSATSSSGGIKEVKEPKMTIWYVQNDGVSNAEHILSINSPGFKLTDRMSSTVVEACPTYAAFLSQAGITFAAVLSAFGAAYGTVKSGMAISSISTSKPDAIIKSLLPVIMAGILSIYGLVVGIFIALLLSPTEPLTLFAGGLHLGAGLSVGLACLASGLAIGTIGEVGVRGYAKQPRFFFGLILLLVFAEVLGIYGFIGAGMLVNKTRSALSC